METALRHRPGVFKRVAIVLMRQNVDRFISLRPIHVARRTSAGSPQSGPRPRLAVLMVRPSELVRVSDFAPSKVRGI